MKADIAATTKVSTSKTQLGRLSFIITVKIQMPTGIQDIVTLVDSGMEANFIHEYFAKSTAIKLNREDHKAVRTIDGCITHSFGTMNIVVGATDALGETRAMKHTFKAISLSSYDIVLGYPWLKTVNPDIDWSEDHFQFRVLKEQPIEEYMRGEDDVETAVSLSAEDAITKILAGAVVYILHIMPANLEKEDNTINLYSVKMDSLLDLPDFIKPYKDVFSAEATATTNPPPDAVHDIDTEQGLMPLFLPIYSLLAKELDVLREYLNNTLEKGWILPSKSPAGTPIMFMPKKDGGLHLCVDYCGLNHITLKNCHPLPLVGEMLDRLSEAKVFSKMDLCKTYHHINIHKEHHWKTAFHTHYGHFEYNVMPFSLANAPVTFQDYINSALSNLLDDCCIVYLDDILIYSDNEEEHKVHVQKVLHHLHHTKLFCKASKCKFMTDKISFLSFVVGPNGVEMESEWVATILEWSVPRNIKEVQSFLSFANFYQRFIYTYLKVATTLFNLTKGPKKGEKCTPFV